MLQYLFLFSISIVLLSHSNILSKNNKNLKLLKNIFGFFGCCSFNLNAVYYNKTGWQKNL